MKSKQTMFFALLEDIEKIIKDFESAVEVQYFKTGLFDTKDIRAYGSFFETPNIGITLSGDWNRIDNYLIVNKFKSLIIREVPQNTGEMKFAIDQKNNPKSIELKPGGVYKEYIIVAGRVATISEDSESLELFKLLSTKIKKDFRKIGAFYVGKSAEKKLKEGWRLVTNEKSPKEYDLRLT